MSHLQDRVVVVTRAVDQAGALTSILRDRGARVVAYPTIEIAIVTHEAAEPALRVMGSLAAYDAVLLSSANAVRALCELAARRGIRPQEADTAYFCLGKATAAVAQQHGLSATTAGQADADGLRTCVVEHFEGQLAGRHLLVPRAKHGRAVLVDGLRAAGAEVDVVTLYETRPLLEGPVLPAEPAIDWVTFMSPSAVRGFVARAGLPNCAKVACIGRVTTEAAASQGLSVDVVAAEQTAAALVDAIERAPLSDVDRPVR